MFIAPDKALDVCFCRPSHHAVEVAPMSFVIIAILNGNSSRVCGAHHHEARSDLFILGFHITGIVNLKLTMPTETIASFVEVLLHSVSFHSASVKFSSLLLALLTKNSHQLTGKIRPLGSTDAPF
jgi:hypothetical protein